MKVKKPSVIQYVMLLRMADACGRIFREPGGFWTVGGVARTERRTPVYYVAVGTIRSAEASGFIQRAFVHPEEWRDERVLTPAGEAIVAGPPPKISGDLRHSLEHLARHGGDTHEEELATLGLAEKRDSQWVLTERGRQALRAS
jgi:hypothetical protein